MPNRYVIVGAGAIGGAVGGRLHQAGRPVVLVARGAHLEVLRRDGLRLRTPTEDVRLEVPAVGGPDELELGVDDVLVHVAVRDSPELRRFVLEHLSTRPEVAHTQTSLVFEHVHAPGTAAL